MKRSVWASLGVMTFVVALVVWWQQSGDVMPTPKLSDSDHSETTTQEQVSVRSGFLLAEQDEPLEDEFNPYESEVFKAQIQQVADLFEQESKYPIGSRPIRNSDAVREPEPFEFNEVDLPFSEAGEDGTPIRIAAATNTYQYFHGDLIEVRVQISGAPTDIFVGVNGNLSSAKGDIPLPLTFQASDASLTQFIAQIDSSLLPAGLTSPEMTVIVNVKVGSNDLLTTVSFRYDQPSAQVVGTMPARVEGPNLVIPMQVTVGQTGYYFLRAVLEDATNRKPLIELQNEGPLTSGNGLLDLNAHITALRFHQSEGPYILRSVKLHRGAEQGESFDVPAANLQPEFQVQGFPFSNYEDEEHVDELAQERLEFLRQMGSIDDEGRSSLDETIESE